MMIEDETEVFMKSDNPSENLRKISSEAQKRKSTPAKGTYNPSTVGVLEQLASTSPRSNSGKWIPVPGQILRTNSRCQNGSGIHDQDIKQQDQKATFRATFQNYRIQYNRQLFTRKVFDIFRASSLA